jgi:predicted GNAT family N-acyltransferase
MTGDPTEVRPARGEAEVRAALDLRREVFVGEQGVPLHEELDHHDAGALHLVAVRGGAVVGTCRLVRAGETVELGRMAVAPAERGRGLAARLLAEVDAQATGLGARRIALAAQLSATGLYERAGYRAFGDRFLDAGIEHLMMDKRLA